MTRQDLEIIVVDALRRIAPDVDAAAIDRNGDIRDECDIDSIDFLNLVTALGKRFSLPVPEQDYPRLQSLAGIIDYLDEKAA